MTRASCHCGKVELEFDGAEPLHTAARCDCSFCRRRQAGNISVSVNNLRVIKGADALTLYTWGTGTAQHFFCATCGIYTHHQRRSDPSVYGVNIGCIDGVNPRDYEPMTWNDGVTHPSDLED